MPLVTRIYLDGRRRRIYRVAPAAVREPWTAAHPRPMPLSFRPAVRQ